MSDFPSSIYTPREKENKSGVVYNPANKTVGYVEDITKLDDEVVALETLFGKNSDGQTTPIAGAVLKGKVNGKSKWSTELFIDTNGRVGIGTTNPGQKFEVKDTTSGYTNVAKFWNNVGSDNEGVQISLQVGPYENTYIRQNSGSGTQSGPGDALDTIIMNTWTTNDNGDLIFGTNNTEQMRVNHNGNVGIGTTTPTAKLHLKGSGSTSATEAMRLTDSSGNGALMVVQDGGNVGIGTRNPTALLDVNSNLLRIRIAKTPATAGASGNVGDICWDENYIYVCVSTNNWKRVEISTWL